MRIYIDQTAVDTEPGTTVWEAAAAAGIEIPSMCYRAGCRNHPSCMVCVVQDEETGRLVPSCATKVRDGLRVLSDTAEVIEARKEALELLLSDHVGDCEAPCRLSCPAFMNIPGMCRMIAAGRIDDALRIVREDIALPVTLGFICPAPCEKSCRRKKTDAPVSICALKRFTAQDDARRRRLPVSRRPPTGKRVAVIGSGPAGLAAAFHLAQLGHACVVYEKQPAAGGAMRSDIPRDLLPDGMLEKDLEPLVADLGVEFRLACPVTRDLWDREIQGTFDAVILATGCRESHPLPDLGLADVEPGATVDRKRLTTSRPGVFGCGSVVAPQRLAVRSLAQGKQAAREAHAFLTGSRPPPSEKRFNSVIGPLRDEEQAEYLKEASPEARIDPGSGHAAGFTADEARREAARCMHCDCRKPDDCKLRIYAQAYGADRKRYEPAERAVLTRQIVRDRIVYEPEKCIRCGLCVEIARLEGEPLGLAHIGRGFDVRIAVPFGKALQEGLERAAEACARSCPTGALALVRPDTAAPRSDSQP